MTTSGLSVLPTDPFARVRLPLAAFIDSQGFAEVKPHRSGAERFPVARGLSKRLLTSLGNRHYWGYQFCRSSGEADWVTYMAGESVATCITSPDPNVIAQYKQAAPLRIAALRSHFESSNKAVGVRDTLDLPETRWGFPNARLRARKKTPGAEWDIREERFVLEVPTDPNALLREVLFGTAKTTTASIRIDVDADETWLDQDRQALTRQLRAEQRIADDLGLPYSVFRSGGRGTQAVIRLPLEVAIPTANFLSIILKKVFVARATEGVKVDEYATKSLLRLPGAVHQAPCSFGLGLWLDPDSAEILPISEQIELMGSVYEPLADCWLRRELKEIEQHLAESGKTQIDDRAVGVLLEGLSSNELIQRWREVMPTGSISVESSVGEKADSRRGSGTGECQDYAWAKRKFHGGYQPGESWEYFQGGGIRAAFILFGPAEAKQRLIEQALSVPARSDAEMNKRLRTIRGLCEKHEFEGPSCGVSSLTDQDVWILERLDERLEQAIRRKDKKDRIRRTLRVCVPMFRGQSDGEARVSATYLVEAFERREWPPLSMPAARRVLDAITEGQEECVLPVLVRRDKRPISANHLPPCVFKAGATLRELINCYEDEEKER